MASTAPDRSTPNYVRAIVTFVDVLGFRQLVASKTAADIARIIRRFREYAANEKLHNLKLLAFSDSIVRIRPIDSAENRKYPSGLVFHELYDLCLAQLSLANEGILIRGGVSVGEIYYDADLVFGPAFIASYKLESEFARVPRIAIDPELLRMVDTEELVKAVHHDSETEKRYIRSLLDEGDDGVWHIDYLRTHAEVDDDATYLDFLGRHRDTITALAKQNSMLSSIALKVNWLARYHNRVVEELRAEATKALGYEKNSLKVKLADVSTLIDLPD